MMKVPTPFIKRPHMPTAFENPNLNTFMHLDTFRLKVTDRHVESDKPC